MRLSPILETKGSVPVRVMPSSHVGHLGHLSILGYWPDNIPSSCLDSLDPFGHFGLLGHLGYLGTIGNLNTLDPEPIDAPLHMFIEEEPT